jgi:hypothetical protein
MLSNILCYCSDDKTADFFLKLLSPGGGVRAIIANERNAEQRLVSSRRLSLVQVTPQIPPHHTTRTPVGMAWHSSVACLVLSRCYRSEVCSRFNYTDVA